jgi:hypothetical protein
MNKKFYLFLVWSFYVITTLSAQVNIYLEDFSTVPGGTGYSNPLSIPDSIRVGLGYAFIGTGSLGHSSSRFSVNAAEDQLQYLSIRGETRWRTDTIDISCFSNVSFSIQGTAVNNLEPNDYVSLDITVVDDNETEQDVFMEIDLDNQEVFDFSLSDVFNTCGNQIIQKIVLSLRFYANSNFEGYNLDFVQVTGYPAGIADIDYLFNCDIPDNLPDLDVSAVSTAFCPLEYELVDDMMMATVNSTGAFTNLTPGKEYTVNIRDIYFSDCASTSFTVMVPTCQALPIELLSFSGAQQDAFVALKWETAAEINNDFMAIERSSDGINFREIGKVKGAGTTSEVQYYEFLDRQPLTGINYYRLRQVDFDGAFEYHKTIAVEMISRTTPPAIKIYPSIAANEVTIELGFIPQQKITYTIHSLLGQEVRSGIFERETSYKTLPVGELPAGSYVFSTVDEGKRYTARFIKQ